MSEELDINKIVAEFVNQNLENIYNSSKGVLRGAADKIRLRLSNSYNSYLVCVAHRYSKAKSFFIRNEPTNLYEFYVPIGLSSSKNEIVKPSLQAVSSKSSMIVLTGGGGSGKSMLMRHLFLDTIKQKKKVPVFLELRELNQTQIPLIDFIQETLRSNHFALDSEFVLKALKAGHFALFLDGFDEISLSLRNTISKQVQHFTKNYDQNIVIISSRPDNEFSGWSGFTVLTIKPLELEEACELVNKLPFDEELKSKFLLELRKELFVKHESFLSNPLLLSIMLLTYGQSAGIPNKLSVFYNQAYEALYQRHDALKGGFQRERLSKLDIQDFARTFAAFCIQTYDKRAFQFSRSEALQYLDRAKKIINLEFDANYYLADALQSVCLLIEEGLLIVFAHRSFQEYFVARFVCELKPDVQERMIDKYARSFVRDEVMNLLYEMNPEFVERTYILPVIDKLGRLIKLKSRVGISHYFRFLKSQYTKFEVRTDDIHGYVSSKSNEIDVVYFTLKHCGYLVGWQDFVELDKLARLFSEKYGKREFDLSAMTYRDEFIRDLADHGEFFSRQTLQLVFDIRKALAEKHRRAEQSLGELLGA